MNDAEFLRWLIEEGYSFPQLLPGNRYGCLNQRIYNTQLIIGRIGDKISYDTAW